MEKALNEGRCDERLKARFEESTCLTYTGFLDAKTGLLTGLIARKQGWKCPVALLPTCCGSKSLKVILIDSDFRAYLRKNFFQGKNFFSGPSPSQG